MKLDDLIEVIEKKEIIGERSLEVDGISYNSKRIEDKFLFVAIKGTKFDGHDFVKEAIKRGARSVVVEEMQENIRDATVILVPDSRMALAQIASRFYGDPSSKLTLIGITGTNGKTTTSYILGSIFKEAGFKTGIMGTINYSYGDKLIPASMTTPESLDLQKMLAEMVEDGVTHVVMEVSSHALDLKRVEYLQFNAGVFTNFTQDHLDYHQTMENYFSSKAKLFNHLLFESDKKKGSCAIINADDPFGEDLALNTVPNIIRYGVENKFQVFPENISLTLEGTTTIVNTPKGSLNVKSPLIGEFNLYNILAAISVAISQGISLPNIEKGIKKLDNVLGRFERIENEEGVSIIVDYAHTSDALERTLTTIKGLSKGRIITVFGCGGDRDRLKRPLMGAVSGKYSDLSIITSDNPRTEDPNSIISGIEEGIKGLGIKKYYMGDLIVNFYEKGYVIVSDRRQAIRLAIDIARRKDTILIAGKGHEDYQIIGSEKIPFDDRQEAKNAISEIWKGRAILNA
ncbi:MAG: UDP-N-acetylmuramoyl-L-alanyl-D-glutamate--2,6-diaminopimelate ligase [Pseudomonadota bacterium]